MSLDMSPSRVKKREHTGIAGFTLGIFLAATGILGLLLAWPPALLLLGLGAAGVVAGGAILTSIPDLIDTPDKSW